jgi:hypothetical protein
LDGFQFRKTNINPMLRPGFAVTSWVVRCAHSLNVTS